MKGQLWLIGTPIGNLGDMTFRAVDCLRAAGRIYAEDTRRTRTLLSHFGIEGKTLLSLHAHSPERDRNNAIEILLSGEHVALVTDAGMPGISDPGADLVRAARQAGLSVQVIPGPSAVTTAVALCGLVEGPFTFLGFLPRKGSKRKKMVSVVATSPVPTVLFESPHRVADTLKELHASCGPERMVAICRELTKKYEETRVVDLATTQADAFLLNAQGEFTLVVDRAQRDEFESAEFDFEERALTLLAQGLSVRDVSAQLLHEQSLGPSKRSKRELYALVQEIHDSEGAAGDAQLSATPHGPGKADPAPTNEIHD